MLHLRAVKPVTACLGAFTNIEAQHSTSNDLDEDSDASHKTGRAGANKPPDSTLQPPAKAAGRVSIGGRGEGTAAAAAAGSGHLHGRRYAAPDYEGIVNDQMAAELAADLADGDASQQSGSSDCDEHQQRQPVLQLVHGRAQVLPSGGRGAGRGSSTRQPGKLRMSADCDDEGEEEEGSEEQEDSKEGDRAALGHAFSNTPGRFHSGHAARGSAAGATAAAAAKASLPGAISGRYGPVGADAERRESKESAGGSVGESEDDAGGAGPDAVSSMGDQSGNVDFHSDARWALLLRRRTRLVHVWQLRAQEGLSYT